MNIIEVKNLTKVYSNEGAETKALAGVSFSIKKGEFVAIMGPSGSGKSTLLQILGLLDDFSAGEYIFSDKNIKKYNSEEIAKMRNEKMGFVFQAFNLLPKSTVLENVKLPLLYSGIPEETWNKIATDAVEAVGLSHRISHEANQLSGGEKQRVAIARALVTSPDIIFADEPTGNLDPETSEELMEIFKHINKQGKTILMATHDYILLNKYASRTLICADQKLSDPAKATSEDVDFSELLDN